MTAKRREDVTSVWLIIAFLVICCEQFALHVNADPVARKLRDTNSNRVYSLYASAHASTELFKMIFKSSQQINQSIKMQSYFKVKQFS